ncbi:S41 family peptidase [Desulfobacterota bacterium AH_259_B03_O07]|nr:S41 family peptidase [Desulfobacterota bacterium AH_259_B03_O07]
MKIKYLWRFLIYKKIWLVIVFFVSFVFLSNAHAFIHSESILLKKNDPLSDLPETYYEIAYVVKENSYYASQQARWERFVACVRIHIPIDERENSESVEMVNQILQRCLSEDRKIGYSRVLTKEVEKRLDEPVKERQKIEMPYRGWKHEKDESIPTIGYINWWDINAFGLSDMPEVFQKFKDKQIRIVILDLRGNSGGSLYDLQAFLELVMLRRTTPYFVREHARGRFEYFYVEKDGAFSNFFIYVLVDRNTASSAEIVAGILKRNGAIIVGEQTFGKGTVQAPVIFSLQRRKYQGVLTLTTGKLFFSDGTSPDKVGIIPHLAVKSEEALEKVIEYLMRGGKSNGF